MSRILITGGTGFVGQRVVSRLLAQGLTPRVLDLPAALARTALPAGCEAVAGDVTDAAGLTSAAEGCTGIVHLAGIMTRDCARDPALAVAVNIAGGVNMFELARRAGLPVAYLSSAGVFGPEDAAHPAPLTIYGVTKLALEGIARVYAADHGVVSLGLRPYVVYGPGISSGIAAGPSIAIAAARIHQPAEIGFSGRVGFVHADDVARLLVAAMTRPMAGAEVLTLAGDTRDMTDFLAELAHQTGFDGITIAGPPLRIPGDLVSSPVPDWLGPQPVTGIAAGIEMTLRALEAARG